MPLLCSTLVSRIRREQLLENHHGIGIDDSFWETIPHLDHAKDRSVHQVASRFVTNIVQLLIVTRPAKTLPAMVFRHFILGKQLVEFCVCTAVVYFVD